MSRALYGFRYGVSRRWRVGGIGPPADRAIRGAARSAAKV